MSNPDSEESADRPTSTGALELQAIEQLFHEHLNPLTRFVYSYVKSWAVAEDIVHDVFLQLWMQYRTLDSVRDLTAYLYSVARYDALDYLRHERIEIRHREASPVEEPVMPAHVEHDLLASEVVAVLHRAIGGLPERQRAVILLRLDRQASYQDIAAALGISPKTVDAHLQRAFTYLRKVLPRLLE